MGTDQGGGTYRRAVCTQTGYQPLALEPPSGKEERELINAVGSTPSPNLQALCIGLSTATNTTLASLRREPAPATGLNAPVVSTHEKMQGALSPNPAPLHSQHLYF